MEGDMVDTQAVPSRNDFPLSLVRFLGASASLPNCCTPKQHIHTVKIQTSVLPPPVTDASLQEPRGFAWKADFLPTEARCFSSYKG